MKKTLIITLIWVLIINVFAVVALNRLNLEKDSSYLLAQAPQIKDIYFVVPKILKK